MVRPEEILTTNHRDYTGIDDEKDHIDYKRIDDEIELHADRGQNRLHNK